MSETVYPKINDYQLTQPWTTSGGAQWSFAEKEGQAWFIKRFLSPKFKCLDAGLTQGQVDRANARCQTFWQARQRLYQKVSQANTGNLVPVTDFFSFGTSFYAVSARVPVSELSTQQISKLPPEKRLLLMKILTHCLVSLQEQKVVHGDLKPSNIILKRTASGGYTLKLIDFDASFLEDTPPTGEEVAFDPVYVAPETIQAMTDPEVRLDGKIDIFALGLIFHLYWCGQLPELPKGCPHAVHAVAKGDPVKLSPELPEWLRELVGKMLLLEPAQRPGAAQVFAWLQAQKKPEEKISHFHAPEPL